MKYAIIIPDGCADLPLASLGGRTPMQVARTPNLDALARSGIVGRSQNVPPNLPPGSDVATLGLLGYAPHNYYTGRAPLEAVAQGIPLEDDDWAVRCNLVTVADGIMKDFTAGHVSTAEATGLIRSLNETVATASSVPVRFYPGVSYRNLVVVRDRNLFSTATMTFPPHDFTDKPVREALPTGDGSEWLRRLMEDSEQVFADHPINRQRIADGRFPATQIWLWGLGRPPRLPLFGEKYRAAVGGRTLQGAMITAVDLLRGIAKLIGWENIDVPGITGYIDTDYVAKGRYAAAALRDYDVVCVHIEAPDEAGHEGNIEKKVRAMEDIDEKVIPPIVDALQSSGDWRLLVSPDHPTPIICKTHTVDFVPWLIVGSDVKPNGATAFDETTAEHSAARFDCGWQMLESFIATVQSFGR